MTAGNIPGPPARAQFGGNQEVCGISMSFESVYPDAGENSTSQRRLETLNQVFSGTSVTATEIANKIIDVGSNDMALALELKAILDDVLFAAATDARSSINSPATAEEVYSIQSPANPDAFKITHLATGHRLWVPGVCIDFSEKYSPSYTKETVYGRMDPITTYGTTSRTISFGWEVDTNGGSDQYALAAVSDIIKFLYPLYQGTSLKGAPTWRIRFLNLLNGGNGFSESATGLVVVVDDFNITGIDGTSQGMNAVRRQTHAGPHIIPQSYQLTFSFTVLHEKKVVGFSTGGEFMQSNWFPYGYGSTLKNPTQLNADITRNLDARNLDDASRRAEAEAEAEAFES